MSDVDDGPHDDDSHGATGDEHVADDVSATGDNRVDAAVSRLDDLDDADITAHEDIYDETHRSLAAMLDEGADAAGPEQ